MKLWQIRVVMQQKPTHHHKAINLQLKKKRFGSLVKPH